MITDVYEVKAAYFDADALMEAPYKIYSIESKGGRQYLVIDGDNMIAAPAYHSVAERGLPMERPLLEYFARLGLDGARRDMDEKAGYGTLMHEVYTMFICDKRLDISSDNLYRIAMAAGERDNKISTYFQRSWIERLKKNVLSLLAFIQERNVIPRAAEIGLYSPEKGFAGRLDLVCQMEFNKGSVNALIDYKSRYEPYESVSIIAQLYAYKHLWEYNFPMMPINNVFNFHPSDFNGDKATYKLVNRTGKKGWNVLDDAISIYKKTTADWNDEDNVIQLITDGVIEMDSNPSDFIRNISKMTHATNYIKKETSDEGKNNEEHAGGADTTPTDIREDKSGTDGEGGIWQGLSAES